MSRRLPVAVLLAVVVMLLPLSRAEESDPPGDSPPATAIAGVISPMDEGESPAGEAGPRVAALEREAVEAVARKYARRFHDLNELARQTKGLELLAVHKQIEALKREQAREELEVRMELARERGDLERLVQLEQVSEGTVDPMPTPPEDREFRPAPDAPRRGGER